MPTSSTPTVTPQPLPQHVPANATEVANALPEHLHARARTRRVLPWWQFVSLLTQRESRRELDWLTPQRADDLFEAWLRGETAEVQLVWDRLEKFDSTLFACVRSRLSALGEMKWTVNVDADTVGDDAAMQQLADKQRLFLLRCLSDVENLTEAISALGKADFTGVAALEITGDMKRMRWEVINPWHLCRPSIHAPWMYNANADPVPIAPEMLEAESVILREALPMLLPAMFLIVAKRHGVQAWDAFLDKFGIPAAFFETPPGATEEEAMEFDATVQKIIGEGSGTIPSGAKLHTFETARDNTQTFEARARWCDDALLQLILGGKLTMTTEAGSGTLAGNAHQESFERLCAATARSISECINRQFCKRLLREAFPDQPQLALFDLSAQKQEDLSEQAQLIATLSSAGFRPSPETVSEMMGFEVEAVEPTQPATPFSPGLQPITNSATASDSEPNSQIVHRTSYIENSSVEPPLTEHELAALQSLSKGFAPDQLEADADTIYTALADAIAPSEEEQPDEEEEEAIENGKCLSKYGPQGCSNPEHNPNLRAAHKGGRASKGNRTGKKNTPNVVQPGDSEREIKKKLTKAFKKAKEGKNVDTGYEVRKGSELVLRRGKIEEGGTDHAERPAHPIKISPEDLAETVLHGEKQKRHDNNIDYLGKKGRRVILTPEREFPSRKKGEPLPPKAPGKMVGQTWYEPEEGKTRKKKPRS